MKKTLCIVAILMLAFTTKSFAFTLDPQFIPCDWTFTPYIGADVQRRELKFAKNYGNNIFKKKSRHTNVFIGNKFNDCVGIEIGYEMTGKTTRNTTLSPGQFEVGGFPIASNTHQDTYGGTQFHGWHVDLLGFWRFPCENLELLGSVGLLNLKAKLVAIAYGNEVGPVLPNIVRSFSQTKTLVRLVGGFQYTVCSFLGFRATVSFENTNQFRHLLADPVGNAADPLVYAKIKNSVIYGIGAYIYF